MNSGLLAAFLVGGARAHAQEWAPQELEARRDLYIDITTSQSRGSATAPLVLIEFADYHCPACTSFVRRTLPLLDSNYIAPGFVRLIFKDYPIFSLHPGALQPALAAHCAGDQGRYWEMHDALFAHPPTDRRDTLVLRAATLGIDTVPFASCLQRKQHEEDVRRGLKNGHSIGLRGTPTFFVAIAEPGAKKVKVAHLLYGALDYEYFRRVFDRLLLDMTHRTP